MSGESFRLIVTGGGTGGHTYPAVATVGALRSRLSEAARGLDVTWVGAAGSLESRVAADEGIPFRAVSTGKIRRARNPLKMMSMPNARDMSRVPLGVLQAMRVIRSMDPDVVLATGGYVAVPVGAAAWVFRRPLVLHEQTTRLGLANRVLARGATKVAVSSAATVPLLPPSARASAVVTGNPVRPEVLRGQAETAFERLDWHGADPGLPVVYVTGGAQGSAEVNGLVREILPWLLARASVVHQCGAASLEATRAQAAALPPELANRYVVTDFIGPELPDLLARTDVLISRSGAGTIAEVTALGKATVFVPLGSAAGDEQRHNARHLAAVGAAVALLGAVTPEALRAALEPILTDPALRAKMGDNARAQGRPDAAERLAETLLAAAGTRTT